MDIRAAEISRVIRDQIANFDAEAEVSEVGTVLSVGDGIARVHGLDNCMSLEMLELPHDVTGLTLNLESDNVGVVLQAMLRRTPADIKSLADLRPSVRLCKGIYVEPPSVAFQDFGEVRRSFVGCLEALLDEGCYVGIATHDEWLIEQALESGFSLQSTPLPAGSGSARVTFLATPGPALWTEMVKPICCAPFSAAWSGGSPASM